MEKAILGLMALIGFLEPGAIGEMTVIALFAAIFSKIFGIKA